MFGENSSRLMCINELQQLTRNILADFCYAVTDEISKAGSPIRSELTSLLISRIISNRSISDYTEALFRSILTENSPWIETSEDPSLCVEESFLSSSIRDTLDLRDLYSLSPSKPVLMKGLTLQRPTINELFKIVEINKLTKHRRLLTGTVHPDDTIEILEDIPQMTDRLTEALDPITILARQELRYHFNEDQLKHGVFFVKSHPITNATTIEYVGDFRLNWFEENFK